MSAQRNCRGCGARSKYELCSACARAEHEADWDDYQMSPEEERQAERDYENSKARAEWSHYHPGVPCPASELPYPRNVEASPGDEGTKTPSPSTTMSEKSP